MKKIIHSIFSLYLLIFVNSCVGYEPIFKTNLQFEIADYSLAGDEKLANQLYFKLYKLSNINKDKSDRESVSIFIKVIKSKSPTVKNSAGKILEYKINLNIQVIVRNFLTGGEILSEIFDSSSSYKVQDQYFETTIFENRSVENLINNAYEELLIKLSENMLTK